MQEQNILHFGYCSKNRNNNFLLSLSKYQKT